MADNKLYIEQKISETLESNYMPYAMSVIVSRAIPEIDGFKPSHRKLLYTMYKMGLLNGPRTKSANVVGETMKLNPHGDMAIYETLVRMTKGNEALLHPYVDSKGSFGKVYSRDMAFAAARYTEVKLDKLCTELFGELDKDTVDFVDNYDGTMKEPTLFPVTFPTILVNSNQGLAVGMATNICSFNLVEICEATSALIDNPEENLLKIIKAPDFSTGGIVIYNKRDMNRIIETGKGPIKVRSKYKYDKKNNCIDVYEIPYTTTVEAIIDSVSDLVKTNKIKEVVDIRDETDLKGLKLTIDIKRNTNPDDLMNKLYMMTPLQDTFSCNFNVLIKGKPQLLGVRQLLLEWIEFRIVCMKRKLANEIKTKENRLHLLRGLEKILLDIDKAIKIIRETETDALVIPNLMWGFGIDEIQANFIAEIKLRNLNKEYILDKVSEIENLINDINDLKDTLGSDKKIKELIKTKLQEVAKKHGKPRRTDLMHEDEVVVVEEEEMIDDYNLKVFLTNDSYFKKIPLVSLRSASDQKLKDEDFIVQEMEWHNKSDIIFVSNKQVVYKCKLHELPDCKASSLGEYLPNILEMDDDEKIHYMIVTDNYAGFILFAYENGKVSKIPLNSYETKTNRRKLLNAYGSSAPLVDVIFTHEDLDIALVSSNDRALVINSSMIPLKTTRSSQGVQVMRLRKGCVLQSMMKVSETSFKEPKVYRVKNIPAAGPFIKAHDREIQQMSLLNETE
ncbi:MAG TPA: topoisomerase IV [Clostridiaceae bacterium]|jgi:DNA gyrase subunit A|nr:topoisomerase IV [Clostridiaceae bacterium]